MSRNFHHFLSSVVLAFVCAFADPGVALARSGSAETREPVLRTDPLDEIAAEIEQLVQKQLDDGTLVGLQVALLRDGHVVWERGFGVANTVTREPLTTETVFPAASLGKPLVAYLALLEVDRGRLVLDLPLRQSLPQSWAGDAGAGITLRHVVTHTSGLSNFLRDRARKPAFPPGKRFSYSGLGFMYLQEALRAVRSESLDATARAGLFGPLGMSRSYFGVPPAARLPHASGHTRLQDLILPVAILHGPGTLLMLAIVWLATGIFRGRWLPTRSGTAAGVLLATATVMWFLYARSGSLTLSLYFVGCYLALVAAATAAGMVLAWCFARIVPSSHARYARIAGATIGFTLALVVALPRFVPIPSWFPEEGNAASSLRSTAGDLGRFLGELCRPHLLKPETANSFRTSQVRVSRDISWGLGVGIQHSDQGDSLWHLGSNPASKAFFVVYPARGMGVVVLTNSDGSLALAQEIAARALGGKAAWSLVADP